MGTAFLHVFHQEAVRKLVDDGAALDCGGIFRLTDFRRIFYFRLFLQVIAVQVIGQDAGDHHHEWDDELEERGEHNAHLTFRQGFGSQRTLHDVLVEAPVKEVGNPQAQAKSRPRDFRIIRRTDHVQLAAHGIYTAGRVTGVQLKKARHPMPEAVRRIPQGGNRRAGIGGGGLNQMVRVCAAELRQGKIGYHAAAHNQGGAPEQVRPGAGFQPAHEHVYRGAEGNDNAADGDVAEVNAHGRVSREEHGDHLGAGVNHARSRHAYQNQQRGNGHQGTGQRVIPVFQEFGNRIYAAFQQLGKETEGYNHQRDCGQPFIPGDGHAHPVGRFAGHPHKLFRGNVGGNQGETHQPPGQTAAGKEIV